MTKETNIISVKSYQMKTINTVNMIKFRHKSDFGTNYFKESGNKYEIE